MSKQVFPTQQLEDQLMCQGYSTLDANHRQQNLVNYMENVYVPGYYKCSKDPSRENELLFPLNDRMCDKEVVIYRGRNNKHSEIDKRKHAFLIPFCDCNTYNNGILCDGKKCCSKSHQLFMNYTRRNAVKKCWE